MQHSKMFVELEVPTVRYSAVLQLFFTIGCLYSIDVYFGEQVKKTNTITHILKGYCTTSPNFNNYPTLNNEHN
jgi:hypothetical protein